MRMYRVSARKKNRTVAKAIVLAASKEEAIEKFVAAVSYIDGCRIDAYAAGDVYTF